MAVADKRHGWVKGFNCNEEATLAWTLAVEKLWVDCNRKATWRGSGLVVFAAADTERLAKMRCMPATVFLTLIF